MLIWWLVAGNFIKTHGPQLGKLLWRRRDVVLSIVLVLVLLRCCGMQSVPEDAHAPIKEIIREVPVIRYVTKNDSLVSSIYDSIFNLFKDSVDIVKVRRDSVVYRDGDTIVITDSVEIEVPRCWNEYHKLLGSHTATNSYLDTIYIIDTLKRALRKDKSDTSAIIYLTEDVQENKIKLRTVSYQDFHRKASSNKRIRFYGGVIAGGNKGLATLGPSFLVAGNRFGGGYLYLLRLPDFQDSHNALLYYRLSK